MTNPDFDAAVAAAVDGSVASEIWKATFGSIEAALNDQVSPAVLHQVDEALSMPSVGAVARTVDPLSHATEEAISAAVDAASESFLKERGLSSVWLFPPLLFLIFSARCWTRRDEALGSRLGRSPTAQRPKGLDPDAARRMLGRRRSGRGDLPS
jgi:hypothetical protein